MIRTIGAMVVALATTIATMPSTATAQQRDSTRTDSSAQRIAPVITTATRAPARAELLPQRITTITRGELDRTPHNDAVDALKKLAGVDVIQYPSLLGYVSIRGFRPSSGTQTRTLTLIDGRPAGSFNLALLDMSTVERVELVKGPASAIYGSSAEGGVVNFITRRSTGRPTGSFSALYGTYALSEITGRAGGTIAHVGRYAIDGDVTGRRYEQGANYRIGRDGFFRGAIGSGEALKSYPGTAKPPRVVIDTAGDAIVRDYSTFLATSGSARVGVQLPASFRVDVRGDLFDADDVLSPGDVYARLSNFPGDARKNVGRKNGEIALRRDAAAMPGMFGLTHAPMLRGYNAQEESENFDAAAPGGFINFLSDTRTTGGQLQDIVRRGAQTVTVGVDVARIQETSQRFSRAGTGAAATIGEIGTFSPNSRQSSVAGFAQAQLEAMGGRVTGIVGGRFDAVTLELLPTPLRSDVTSGSDDFGVFNPNIGATVEIVRGLRAHATAGRAFLNPGASNLAGFSQSVTNNVASITVGNPTLRPEHSVTVDGGLSYVAPSRGVKVDVTYFTTSVEDRITSARASFPAARRPTTGAGQQISSITTATNAGEAHVRGFESEVRYDFGVAARRSYSLAVFASGTRIFRAEEQTPAVTVDTTGIAAVQSLDARVVFDRVRLDETRTTTARIKNVASFTGLAGIDFDDNRRFSGRIGARYVGKRLDSDFSDAADPGDIEYSPFLVVDLTAGIRLRGRYRVEGQVSNLTDENYYEKRGYNLAGRVMRLRLSAGF